MLVIASAPLFAFGCSSPATESDAASGEEELRRRRDAGAPDADAGPPPEKFLIQEGVGSVDEANGYYALNIPNFRPGSYTLSQWRASAMGTLPVSTAFYRNKNELGFWRQMSCSAQIGRGVGGCVVTNWQNETDPSLGVPNRGSVAMDISSAGVTRFYVFGPDDVLTPKARLDSEGDKFVPRICTVCHGGSYPQPGTSSDLGAMFHEFEPSSFQLRSGIDQAGAEQEWFALNQRVRGANTQIRREAEGALPAGEAAALSADLDRDVANGRVVMQASDAAVERDFAKVLEKCFSPTSPVFIRTNDALHLASAIAAGETEFVTADLRQRAAAKLMGLTVQP